MSARLPIKDLRKIAIHYAHLCRGRNMHKQLRARPVLSSESTSCIGDSTEVNQYFLRYFFEIYSVFIIEFNVLSEINVQMRRIFSKVDPL